MLNNAKAPNYKLVAFEPPDSGATNRQPINSEGADGQRANREGGKRQRPDRSYADRLCPGADRGPMSESSLGNGSIVSGNGCFAFTRKHQSVAPQLVRIAARFKRGLTFKLTGGPRRCQQERSRIRPVRFSAGLGAI